jgi:hypothetical protein
VPKFIADVEGSGFECANHRFKFQKRSQFFIRVHNETLSVVAVRVNDPERSRVAIHRRNTAPTPTGFTQIVRDYFTILHCDRFSLFCSPHGNNFSSHHVALPAKMKLYDSAFVGRLRGRRAD